MPKRKFESVREFKNYVSKAKELIFDGTENPTERHKAMIIRRISLVARKKHILILP